MHVYMKNLLNYRQRNHLLRFFVLIKKHPVNISSEIIYKKQIALGEALYHKISRRARFPPLTGFSFSEDVTGSCIRETPFLRHVYRCWNNGGSLTIVVRPPCFLYSWMIMSSRGWRMCNVNFSGNMRHGRY